MQALGEEFHFIRASHPSVGRAEKLQPGVPISEMWAWVYLHVLPGCKELLGKMHLLLLPCLKWISPCKWQTHQVTFPKPPFAGLPIFNSTPSPPVHGSASTVLLHTSEDLGALKAPSPPMPPLTLWKGFTSAFC